MSAVMLLLGTEGSLLLVQRTVTRTIVLQETIGKGFHSIAYCGLEVMIFLLNVLSGGAVTGLLGQRSELWEPRYDSQRDEL
ncbi:hypothetical protein STEG23_034674 [Scotinomys teguina]